MYVYNTAPWRWKQEDQELKVILATQQVRGQPGLIVTVSKQNRKQEGIQWLSFTTVHSSRTKWNCPSSRQAAKTQP